MTSSIISFSLNPADIPELNNIWTMEGWDELGDGILENSVTSSMRIESMIPRAVPLLSALILIGVGVILLSTQRRQRLSQ